MIEVNEDKDFTDVFTRPDLFYSNCRSLLDNPWHNASFEGSGFVRLFLPTNLDNQEFFSK